MSKLALVSHDGVPVDTNKPLEPLRPEVGGDGPTPLQELMRQAERSAKQQSNTGDLSK